VQFLVWVGLVAQVKLECIGDISVAFTFNSLVFEIYALF